MDSRDLQGLMEAYIKVCAPVDEAVYGGEPKKPEAPKDDRMVVTAADKKGNTPAYQKFKAGHKGYKAADHLGEESVDEGMSMKDFKANRKKNERQAATADARSRGHEEPSTGRTYSTDEARSRRKNIHTPAGKPNRDGARDAAGGETGHGGPLRANKVRKAKAMGELGEEVIDEAVKGASPHAMEMRKGDAADRRKGIKPLSAKKGEDYAKYKMSQMAHSKRERMGEEVGQVDELYKGKHGQSETEYQDSRSNAGKIVSGTSKLSGAAYSYRGVKNSGPNPAGGSQKPQGQGRMTPGQRTEMQYRKANLMKKEELDIFDAILEYLVAEGYAATNKEAFVIMANLSEEEILEYRKLAAGLVGGMMALNMMKPGMPSPEVKRPVQEPDRTELVSQSPADKAKKEKEERRQAELYAQSRVDQAKKTGVIESQYARENPEKYEREQAKKTSKKEKAMNDPHTGINSPAFEKFMRQQMGR